MRQSRFHLRHKGAHLTATEQPVDTSTAAGKVFFDMLGVFAEFETKLRRERQAEGIVAAKQRGAYRGRPPRTDMEAIKQRLAKGQSQTEIARDLGISRGAVYKARADMSVNARRSRPDFLLNPGNIAVQLEESPQVRSCYVSQDVHMCTFGPLGPSGVIS